nr:FUSC family protein [Nocardiopsis halotolerans]
MYFQVPRDAAQRVRQVTWRAILAAVTAALAWWLAQLVLDEPTPVFAPITAMVSLLDAPGARGRRAFRVIGGVVVGVVVGEVLVRHLGTSPWEIGVAAGIAVLLASTFSMNPLTVIQAGIAALLVIAMHTPETGYSRLLSALIGGLLALVVSQVLATPSPLALLERAARTALTLASRGLRGAGRALTDTDPAAAQDTLRLLRAGYRELAALYTSRDTGREIARWTLRGRGQRRSVHEFDDRLAHLDSLYIDVLLVAYAVHEVIDRQCVVPEWVIRAVDELARAVEAAARDLRSQTHRHHAGALAEPLLQLTATDVPPALAVLVTRVRLTAVDLTALTR